MTEFLRDPETGYLYAYRDGRLVGPVAAMGENPPAEPSCDLWKRKIERSEKGDSGEEGHPQVR